MFLLIRYFTLYNCKLDKNAPQRARFAIYNAGLDKRYNFKCYYNMNAFIFCK